MLNALEIELNSYLCGFLAISFYRDTIITQRWQLN